MTAAQDGSRSAFGASASERALRAATGGGLATAAVTAGFFAAGFEWRLLLLLTVTGAVGTVLAWVLEGARPAAWPAVRYAVLGAALALLAAVVVVGQDVIWLVVAGPVAVTVGGAGGALAALAATRLPRAWLPLVLCTCGVVVLAVLAAGVARTRPWLPGSYLKVEGATNWSSAPRLAELLAQRLQAQPDPLSDEAWEQVAFATVTPDEGGSVEAGYERTATERAITVWVNGDVACVLVRAKGVVSYTGSCRTG